MMNFVRSLVCVGLLAPVTLQAAEVVELRVFPEEIALFDSSDRQRVVVQAVYDDGLTRDVTDSCEWAFANEALVGRDGDQLTPRADGETVLTVRFSGHQVERPVKVTGATVTRPVSFKLDVMPVFMKAGCNSGSCHGAARGKDGFRLSLFGYDPDGDFDRLTRELPGRRINFGSPESSLLVTKAVGDAPHTGGKRYASDSEMNATILRWIAAGAPRDPKEQATCTGIELYPRQAVLDGKGETQQTVVIATYSDGSRRDVTSLSAFFTSNDSSAAIDEAGLVTAGDRGEAYVMARFDVFTVGSQFLALPKGLEYKEQPSQPVNYIDDHVAAKLKKLRLHPSPVCSDEEFLRRIYLDLVGLLPTPDDYERFLASNDPHKREQEIDALLQRKEFTEVWVSKWAEWLIMRSGNDINVAEKSVFLYYQWLVQQIGDNVPWDDLVQEILSSTGGTFSTPQTNFYEIERDQLKVAENVAQIFMGMRIQCAQCHNHPFDRWTQDDYYNFTAFFTQIGRKRGEDVREQIVFNRGGGEVKHPVTGQNATPVFLGGGKPEIKGDRRAVLAEWLASPENPYFASNFANRIWHHFFGIGIVEPFDDVRISNPASNPELLDALAAKLVEYRYDFRRLVKDICVSQTYQRSTIRNESNLTDELNFAHQNVRRIKAESMLDVITQVTNTQDDFAKLPPGARAVQIADGATSTYFLTTFGRAKRETACSCEVRMEPTLSQALHLMNGDTVNAKMQQGGVLKSLIAEKLPPREVVNRLYIRCLTRPIRDDEWERLAPLFVEGQDPTPALEDIFWALLNSREFVFNH